MPCKPGSPARSLASRIYHQRLLSQHPIIMSIAVGKTLNTNTLSIDSLSMIAQLNLYESSLSQALNLHSVLHCSFVKLPRYRNFHLFLYIDKINQEKLLMQYNIYPAYSYCSYYLLYQGKILMHYNIYPAISYGSWYFFFYASFYKALFVIFAVLNALTE